MKKEVISSEISQPIAGISFISEWDAKIIQKMQEVLQKAGIFTLAAIVESWKNIPDQDIYYSLDQTLSQLESDPESNEFANKNGKSDTWFRFSSDFRMKVKYISTYEKGERYLDGEYVPIILLNRYTEGMPLLHSNLEITYVDFEERDFDFDKLEQYLLKSGVKFV